MEAKDHGFPGDRSASRACCRRGVVAAQSRRQLQPRCLRNIGAGTRAGVAAFWARDRPSRPQQGRGPSLRTGAGPRECRRRAELLRCLRRCPHVARLRGRNRAVVRGLGGPPVSALGRLGRIGDRGRPGGDLGARVAQPESQHRSGSCRPRLRARAFITRGGSGSTPVDAAD